ncbi:MAG: hypothetical protein HYU58_09035 [Proteobacteria bacterium]|nr:hypothetical protein [Pseudomonadota bacterium]
MATIPHYTLPAWPTVPPEDYELYRRRKIWKNLRDAVLDRDGGKCVRCQGDADYVHHRSYSREVMEGKCLEGLVSICEGCHDYIHFAENGVWRDPRLTEKLLQDTEATTSYVSPKNVREFHTERPDNWPRYSAMQKAIWRAELAAAQAARWAQQASLKEVTYDTIEDARKAARAILSINSKIVEVVDKHPLVRLFPALLTQGYWFPHRNPQRDKRALVIISDLDHDFAKQELESYLDYYCGLSTPLKISKKDRRIFEKAAIWGK